VLPSFSVTAASIWALEILVEAGFRYDSSIYPVKHPSYGMAKAPRTPFRINTSCGAILEFPLTTLNSRATAHLWLVERTCEPFRTVTPGGPWAT